MYSMAQSTQTERRHVHQADQAVNTSEAAAPGPCQLRHAQHGGALL